MAVSRLLPSGGANDFNLNITGATTTVTFDKEYAGGSYSITSSGNDITLDFYAFNAAGTQVAYTSTKAFTASGGFNKIVVLGGSAGDVIGFTFKKTFTTASTTSEVTAGPVVNSISPTDAPNADNQFTITGANFAAGATVAFTGTGYSSTQAKAVSRTNSTTLVVTRPDNLPPSGAPYTITVTNPGVTAPVGSNVHILANCLTAGNAPVWSTAATLPAFSKNVAYSTTLIATDTSDAGSTITYTTVSGLPTGLTLTTAGVLSGTSTSGITLTNYIVRATDSGGNYVDRTFTIPNSPPVWVTAAGALASWGPSAAYSVQLSVTEDDAKTFAVTSGTLPTGLSLSSSGLISGSAYAGTTNGASSFTVTVTDSNSASVARAFTIDFSFFAVNGSFTFTAAGGSGRSPAADGSFTSAYSGTAWTQLTANFTVSGGIQSWVVPVTGTYQFDAVAACGGTGVTSGGGGRAVGTASLTAGETIKIVCAHIGSNPNMNANGGPSGAGGGGGTFVWRNSNSAAIIAAGGGSGFRGGGAGASSQGTSTSTTPGSGSGNGSAGGNCSGGQGGFNSGGGGGGGFGTSNFYGGNRGTGGNGDGGDGGFGGGGGGAASNCYNNGGSGGGAGYQGGNGGSESGCSSGQAGPVGGGGFGYVGGVTNSSYTNSYNNTGNGYVTVTRLS